MTEGQVQGKCILVRNNEEFKITEFELAGSYCTLGDFSNKTFLSLYVLLVIQPKTSVFVHCPVCQSCITLKGYLQDENVGKDFYSV